MSGNIYTNKILGPSPLAQYQYINQTEITKLDVMSPRLIQKPIIKHRFQTFVAKLKNDKHNNCG